MLEMVCWTLLETGNTIFRRAASQQHHPEGTGS